MDLDQSPKHWLSNPFSIYFFRINFLSTLETLKNSMPGVDITRSSNLGLTASSWWGSEVHELGMLWEKLRKGMRPDVHSTQSPWVKGKLYPAESQPSLENGSAPWVAKWQGAFALVERRHMSSCRQKYTHWNPKINRATANRFVICDNSHLVALKFCCCQLSEFKA